MMGAAGAGKAAGYLISKAVNATKQINVVQRGIDKAIQSGKFVGENPQKLLTKALNGKLSTSAIELDGSVAEAIKALNKQGFATRLAAGVVATGGEASIEGINASEEHGEELTNRLNSPEGQQELTSKTIYSLMEDPANRYMFKDGIDPENYDDTNILQAVKPEYLELVQQKVEDNYQKALFGIEETKRMISGYTFALNFPVLYASNMIQFGRSFTGSFRNQRGLLNSAKAALYGNADKLAIEGAERIAMQGGRYIAKKG